MVLTTAWEALGKLSVRSRVGPHLQGIGMITAGTTTNLEIFDRRTACAYVMSSLA